MPARWGAVVANRAGAAKPAGVPAGMFGQAQRGARMVGEDDRLRRDEVFIEEVIRRGSKLQLVLPLLPAANE